MGVGTVLASQARLRMILVQDTPQILRTIYSLTLTRSPMIACGAQKSKIAQISSYPPILLSYLLADKIFSYTPSEISIHP